MQPKARPWAEPHPYGQRQAEQAAFDEAIAQIQLADRLGYGTAWCVEHHFRDGRSASPTPEAILGGLALTTENLRLGFGATLMPFGFDHPARIAERVATVDVLSHGRVEWGTGMSSPTERAAFGVPVDERAKALWREAVEIVVAMWQQERFSWDSPAFTMPERIQTPKPFQDPHPPCWFAVDGEAAAFDAGRDGLGMLTYTLNQSFAAMERHIAAYRAGREQLAPLTGVINDGIGAYTLVHCYDDADEAARYGLWDSVEWWYRGLARFAIEWELPHFPAAERAAIGERLGPIADGSATVDIDGYRADDMVVIGTPDECVGTLRRYADAGVDQLLCFVQFGTLPHERIVRSLELLAGTVMPALEADLAGSVSTSRSPNDRTTRSPSTLKGHP